MTREERELSIKYLEGIKDNYIDGYGYERHPLPEYYAIKNAIKALEQESVLDKIRAEIAEHIEFNKKMNYMGIVSGLALAKDVIDKYKVKGKE